MGKAKNIGRESEGDIAQILDVESEVDARALGAAVAEEVADRLQRCALAQQVDGERVPQAVRSLVRDG